MLGPRDKAAHKSTNRSVSSEASSFFSQPVRGNVRRTGRIFPENDMLSEAFWTPNIASSQFDEYSQLGSRTKARPIKNQLGSPNTPN